MKKLKTRVCVVSIIQKDDKILMGKHAKNVWFWGIMLAILIVGTAPIGNNLRYGLILPLVLLQLIMSFSWLSKEKRGAWWNETIKFVSQIVPLLLIGVFFASAITRLIPKEQFKTLASQINLLTNFFRLCLALWLTSLLWLKYPLQKIS